MKHFSSFVRLYGCVIREKHDIYTQRCSHACRTKTSEKLKDVRPKKIVAILVHAREYNKSHCFVRKKSKVFKNRTRTWCKVKTNTRSWETPEMWYKILFLNAFLLHNWFDYKIGWLRKNLFGGNWQLTPNFFLYFGVFYLSITIFSVNSVIFCRW